MRLIRRFPVLAYAVVLLGILGLCIAQQSIELLLVAGALAAFSWYVTEGPRGKCLPRWVSLVLIGAVVLNALVELFVVGALWVETLGRFSVWMTLIKLYERKSARDYAQLLLLSLLLMITGAVQSSELLFGLVLLLYVLLGLYVVLLYRLYASNETARETRRAAGPIEESLALPARTIIGRSLHRHFRGLAGAVGVSGVVLSVMVFFVFPRGLGEGTVALLRQVSHDRVSGFSEEIHVLDGTRITESRRLVMTVRLLGSRKVPHRLGRPILMRGSVLDDYLGNGRWGRVDRRWQPVAADAGITRWLGSRLRNAGSVHTAEITLSSPQRVLFSAGVPVALVTPENETVLYDRWRAILSRDASSREGYAVSLLLHPTDGLLAGFRGPHEPQPLDAHRNGLRLLQNDTVRDLAVRLLERARLPTSPPGEPGSQTRWSWNRAAAGAFRAHLQSARFRYDLDLSDIVTRPDEDPIRRFLLETRRGHCEYFASALAALCANVDIPVRLVAGYVASAWDETQQQYMVLESNAHAWAEVRTGVDLWTTFDPTPAAAFAEQHDSETTTIDRFSWLYERFEGMWNHSVATFDARSQDRLIGDLDERWTSRIADLGRDVRLWLQSVNMSFHLGPAGYIWMGVVMFAIVLAVMVLVKLMRRSRAVHRTLRLQHFKGSEYQRLLRHLAFYLDMLNVLRRGRMAKPHWQPPLAFARVLAPEHPEASRLVRSITELAYRERYGGGPLSRDEVRAARDMVGELAECLGVRA